jgi:Alpha galactosidase A
LPCTHARHRLTHDAARARITGPTVAQCISEALIEGQARALVSTGLAAAGYTFVVIDDCWSERAPPRDPATAQLRGDARRFPSGMAALAASVHARGLKFGLYTAASNSTCAAYPGSLGREALDAATFASWGVDYLKVDGCGEAESYATSFPAITRAMRNAQPSAILACSWAAYLGPDESHVPFSTFVEIGCNNDRFVYDIRCNWVVIATIIDHLAVWSAALAPFAHAGHWHDMDMLMLGNECLTHDEERTQLALWAIGASPLLMSNDLRSIPAASVELLTNPDVIAVDQDPLGRMGGLLAGDNRMSPVQRWWRVLANGDVAVALYNKCDVCPVWDVTVDERRVPCTRVEWDVTTFGPECYRNKPFLNAESECCNDPRCVGFTWTNGEGCRVRDTGCGVEAAPGVRGYYRPAAGRRVSPQPVTISVQFHDLKFAATSAVSVYDLFERRPLGVFCHNFAARDVPPHGVAFLRLSVEPEKHCSIPDPTLTSSGLSQYREFDGHSWNVGVIVSSTSVLAVVLITIRVVVCRRRPLSTSNSRPL